MENRVDHTDVQLFLQYPFIMKIKENNVVTFSGYVDIENEDYKILIKEKPDNNFSFELQDDLYHLQPELERTVKEKRPRSILEFLDMLTCCVSKNVHSSKSVNHSQIYKHVLEEYSEFTRFYLNLKTCRLASDLSNIKFSTVDEQNREHFLLVKVNFDNERNLFEILEYDLPQDREQFKRSSSLREVYDYCVGLIDGLQPYFNLMDTLDNICWILDPVQSKRRFNYRRIWIGENVSIIVIVDPLNVAQIPEIKLLGPEELVESYRTAMNENLPNWNAGDDTVANILQLLGLEAFPEKCVTEENMDEDLLFGTGDCSICFAQRLNEKLPEIVCKNKACGTHYHVECLYEWLMSVNTRRFFSEIAGNCPNCEKQISCPLPTN